MNRLTIVNMYGKTDFSKPCLLAGQWPTEDCGYVGPLAGVKLVQVLILLKKAFSHATLLYIFLDLSLTL